MRATRTAFGLLLFCGAAHAGEEPKKIDLSSPAKWEVGEVVTRTIESSQDLTISEDREDGAFAPPRSMRRSLETTWVQQCVEAGSDGKLLRSRVRVDRWNLRDDGAEDESLVGAVFETSPDGWWLVASPRNPSSEARAWLTTRFGPGAAARITPIDAMRPLAPVAVGDEWDCDPAHAKEICANGSLLALAPPDPKIRLRLDGMRATDLGEAARVVLSGELRFPAGPAADGSPVEFLEDSTIEMRGELEILPGREHHHAKGRVTNDYDVRMKLQGRTLYAAGSGTQTYASVRGGEAPKVPERAAAAGPVVRIAVPALWKAGDAFVETGTEVHTIARTPVDGDGREGTPDRDDSAVDWSAEFRCTEVDSDRAPVAISVKFLRFRRVEEGAEDTSLQGAVIEWRATGWKIAKASAKPSKSAVAWLRGRLTRPLGAADSLLDVVTPAAPVAKGDSWIGDGADAASALRADFGYPLAGKSSAEGTLVNPGSDRTSPCEVSYRASAGISCVAGCDCPNAEVMRGGTIEVTGTATGTPADWTRASGFRDVTKVSVSEPGVGAGCTRVSWTRNRAVERKPVLPSPQ